MQISTTYSELTNFFITNKQRLLNFLKEKVNETDAQDILHNAFINAAQSFPSFQGKAQLSTWFTAILHNLVCDHYHSQGRFEQLQPEDIEHNSHRPSEEDLPDELKCLLRKAVDSLHNPNHTQIINFRYYSNFQLTEIQKVLKINYKTIESRHRQALKFLKNLIVKEPQFRGLVEYAKAKGFKICQG